MIWHAHFLGKVLLAWQGAVAFDVLANLLLAGLCYWPLARYRHHLLRQLLASALAVLLLVHEGTLPPWSRWPELLRLVSGFSLLYWMELLQRFVNTVAGVLLVALLGALWLASRKYRLEPWIVVSVASLAVPALLASALRPASTEQEEATSVEPPTLTQFQQAQANLRMTQLAFASEFTPDLVLLHVCSLSWDDMRHIGMTDRQFVQLFDVVLGQFNSATSYSGPAMLRLVNSTCGQATHDQLYGPPRTQCNLLQALSQAGYDMQVWLNHSGQFDAFGQSLQAQSPVRVQTAVDFPDVDKRMQAFDGSELVDDEALLLHWWQGHQPLGPVRALYYNTISLHDGNRSLPAEGGKALSYAPRLEGLFGAVRKLLDKARQSRRGLLLVFVPEHGAALRPQGLELGGLRNTPWPTITHVPVGLVMVSANTEAPRAMVVKTPSSYLSLSTVLGQTLSTRKPQDELPAAAHQLSPTPWIADNGDRLVAWHHEQTWMLNAQDKWEVKAGIRALTPAQP